MRVVVATQYWRPYRSGLTLMEAAVAEAVAAAGHEVTAIAGRHDDTLAKRERMDGVDVVRVPVRARVDRALIAPGIAATAVRAARRADVLVLPLPLPEAAPIALAVAVGRAPRVVVHFHCDPELARGGLAGTAALHAMDASARVALRRADTITATSRDYAEHSRVLAPYAPRIVEIPPMVGSDELPHPTPDPAMEARMAAPPVLRVGFLGRLTHEKGLTVLVEAAARAQRPLQLVLAGASDGAAGGGLWPQLQAQAETAGVDATYLGPLSDAEVAPFLTAIDVLALPSVNGLEAWGRVQAEAMLCGTPVVATSLPGVRTLVPATGMGEIVAPGDAVALAAALQRVGTDPTIRPRDEVIAKLGLGDALERHVAAVLGTA